MGHPLSPAARITPFPAETGREELEGPCVVPACAQSRASPPLLVAPLWEHQVAGEQGKKAGDNKTTTAAYELANAVTLKFRS